MISVNGLILRGNPNVAILLFEASLHALPGKNECSWIAATVHHDIHQKSFHTAVTIKNIFVFDDKFFIDWWI